MNVVMKSSITAVFVFALSAVGYAAEHKSSKMEDWPSFRKADADNSGAISMEEARTISGLGDTFTQYDKNNDGQLSRSEYESAKKAAKSAGKSESGSSGAAGGASGGASSSPGGGTGSTNR